MKIYYTQFFYFFVFLSAVAIPMTADAISDSLITTNSSWKYLDNGSNQGTAWSAVNFNDASWASGNAELGYGDGGEATVVSYGSNANNKYITTYFRRTFTVANPSLYTSLTFGLVRDDGAIVYLNGTEVYRNNLPAGSVNFKTKASTDIIGTNESTFIYFTLASTLLISGNNNVSVEIHQFDKTSPDISFKLNLAALQASLCSTPTGLTTTNITTTSAMLNWSAVSGAVSYNIQYRVVGNPTWSTTASTTPSAIISSLIPTANYEWQAQSNCGSSNLSVFSALDNFTTLTPPCNTPAGLSTTNITTTSAMLNWNTVSGAVSYNIQYRVVGSPTWSTTATATTSATISSLTPAMNYEWQVQSDCGSSNLSVFSALANFTTSTQICSTPTGLSTTSITTTSAMLNWNTVIGALSYNIQYRVVGSPTWNTTTLTNTSVAISSLLPSTNYEWQVQADCGSSNLSTFSSSSNFSTPAVPCDAPAGLTASSIATISAVLSWNSVSGASSYNYHYRINGAPVWISSSAPSTSADVSGLTPGSIYEFQVQTICATSSSAFSTSSLFTTQSLSTYDTLISAGAIWKYNDIGANLGTAWRTSGYNDASWAQGASQLGYGDGDETTIVSYGPDANNKYITTYFRKSFTVSNPGLYLSLIINLVRDDGAVVYLNGTEVYRSNMSTGTIAYNTFASTAISGTDESAWYSTNVNTSLLVSGTNVIAVEMHQVNLTSSDLSFNFRLLASRVPAVVRGPYLQILTSNSVIVRWQTNVAGGSRVRCGLSAISYTMNFYDTTSVSDHIVQVSGLAPATRYYYTIENQTYVLQGNNNNYFHTAPVVETAASVRIWAIGDFGNASAGQTAVRDAYVNYTGTTYTNLWLWLGDNAYTNGTDAEYQSKVFDVYKEQFKKIPLYPAPGNHDYANVGYQSSSALTSVFPYFRIVSVPTAAEAGGIASGTEKYYSYDYANIHFISLDSYGVLNSLGSPMYNWLVSDLDDNRQRWIIVYFHHPPYTKGSHNSDTDTELSNMRENIIPLLENYNVDLVLSGHSHTNERTSLIRGHYGLSGTFNSSMIIQVGSGTQPNPYVKSPPYPGTVYAICGTSGQLSSTVQTGWPMPCMYFSNNTNNTSLVIDINGDQLDCKYLSSTGNIIDQFTIVKTGAPREYDETGMSGTDNTSLAIFPNPFTDETYIHYALKKDEFTELNLYNLSGEKIYSFSDGKQLQCDGKHQFKFSPLSLGIVPGVYFIRLIAGDNISIQKVVFVK